MIPYYSWSSFRTFWQIVLFPEFTPTRSISVVGGGGGAGAAVL